VIAIEIVLVLEGEAVSGEVAQFSLAPWVGRTARIAASGRGDPSAGHLSTAFAK
jgi:hypothetical protein